MRIKLKELPEGSKFRYAGELFVLNKIRHNKCEVIDSNFNVTTLVRNIMVESLNNFI